jgi:hypothetical protein
MKVQVCLFISLHLSLPSEPLILTKRTQLNDRIEPGSCLWRAVHRANGRLPAASVAMHVTVLVPKFQQINSGKEAFTAAELKAYGTSIELVGGISPYTLP